MIQKDTLKFLADLAKNNYREWFMENKSRYDAAYANVLETGTRLLAEIKKFDNQIVCNDPKKCMYRIYRDMRFSPDKTPYKTNMGMIFSPDGTRKCIASSYYMHVMPGGCFVSCGIYMPLPAQLKALRLAIYEDFEEFEKIVSNKNFKKLFGDMCRDDDTLSRVPVGFDSNSPAAEYLKLKHFYVFHPYSNAEVCSADFVKNAAMTLKATKPLQYWLNRAVEDVV